MITLFGVKNIRNWTQSLRIFSNDSNINLEFVFEFRWNLEMLQILSSSVEQQEDVDQTRWPHMEDYSNIALLKVLFT